MDSLERRVAALENRNARVEGDKAWETSFIRRALITAVTYLAVFLYGYATQVRYPALNAMIPAVGFLFSTLTLTAVKKRWLVWRMSPKQP